MKFLERILEQNESMADRAVRLVIGVILAVLAVPPTPVPSPWNYAVGLVALIALVTGLTGSCCVYKLFGWNTLKKAKAAGKPAAKAKPRARAKKKRR